MTHPFSSAHRATAVSTATTDKISNINEIPFFLVQFKQGVPEALHGRVTSSLRVDGDVTMGIVTDVKTELRKAGQLRVNYSAKTRSETL